jgi:hypothetical protein
MKTCDVSSTILADMMKKSVAETPINKVVWKKIQSPFRSFPFQNSFLS